MKPKNKQPLASREEIERMKKLHACGWSVRMLADKFGIAKSSIHRYVTGKVGCNETVDPVDQ